MPRGIKNTENINTVTAPVAPASDVVVANDSRVPIHETHDLPSRGIVYGDIIPGQVTLRAMSTLEEKMRLAGTGMSIIPSIIKRCITSPVGIDTFRMKLFDIEYLMYKLRIVTYGPDYKITLACPYCGESFDVTVDLDSIPVNEVPDDFKEPFEIGPLPISGDIIESKILCINDYIEIEKEAKRIRNKFPDYEGDPEFIVGLEKRILTVNGEDLQRTGKLRRYVENMHARDLRFFSSKYDKISSGYGMDLSMLDICPRCGKDVEYTLPVTDEFFRPTY